jgi:DNA-directed RNA polymerase sigma subunit (sigma70/sigma32)
MLTPKKRQALAMRYGLDGYDREHTFEEIGQALHVSNGRAHQIVLGAERKLQGYPSLQNLQKAADIFGIENA